MLRFFLPLRPAKFIWVSALRLTADAPL